MSKTRSIWRETKFMYLMMTTNLLPLDTIIGEYSDIMVRLAIEKRKGSRTLQLDCS